MAVTAPGLKPAWAAPALAVVETGHRSAQALGGGGDLLDVFLALRRRERGHPGMAAHRKLEIGHGNLGVGGRMLD